MSSYNLDWSAQDVFKVISLYRQFPCLWDGRSENYKSLDMKKNAWDKISKKMRKNHIDVKKKIKNLRSAYVVEKKKVLDSKKSSTSAEDVYQPHLFYFDKMDFLENVVALRKPTNVLPENISRNEVVEFSCDTQGGSNYEDSQESVSETSFICEPPKSSSKANKAKKARTERDKKFNSALDVILNNVSEQDTIFSTFGKSVELQLSQLPLALATKAMAELQQVLAKYMEKINENDMLAV